MNAYVIASKQEIPPVIAAVCDTRGTAEEWLSESTEPDRYEIHETEVIFHAVDEDPQEDEDPESESPSDISSEPATTVQENSHDTADPMDATEPTAIPTRDGK